MSKIAATALTTTLAVTLAGALTAPVAAQAKPRPISVEEQVIGTTVLNHGAADLRQINAERPYQSIAATTVTVDNAVFFVTVDTTGHVRLTTARLYGAENQ